MDVAVSHLESSASHSHEQHQPRPERWVCLSHQAFGETQHGELDALGSQCEEKVVETASLGLAWLIVAVEIVASLAWPSW